MAGVAMAAAAGASYSEYAHPHLKEAPYGGALRKRPTEDLYASYAYRRATESNLASTRNAPVFRQIKLICHGEEKIVAFHGKDLSPYQELKALYFEAFHEIERDLGLEPTVPTFVEMEMPAFELQDTTFGIFFEDFLSDDIVEGAVVRVDSDQIKTAEQIQCEDHAELGHDSPSKSNTTVVQQDGSQLVADLSAVSQEPGPTGSLIKVAGQDASDLLIPGTVDTEAESESRTLLENTASFNLKLGGQHLSSDAHENDVLSSGPADSLRQLQSRGPGAWVARLRASVWDLLDNPLSSDLGCFVMLFIIVTILFSAIVYVIQTIPALSNPSDGPFDSWFMAESVTVAIFTLELSARALCFPGPQRQFWRDSFNVIDLIAIVPYYIEVVYHVAGHPVPVVFRMLRLIRIIRLIKLSKGSVSVFSKTMIASMNLLYMLLFMVFLVTLICGSLMHYAERGQWNPLLGMYMRDSHKYRCVMNITSPTSPALMKDTSSEICGQMTHPDGNMTYYMCEYSFKKSSNCEVTREVGPYISILHSTWFVMQTITTVGFGDDTPVSAIGKSLAAIIIMFGLLVVSLPITVIGSKFSRTYRNHQKRMAIHHLATRFQQMSRLKMFTSKLVYS